MVPSLIATEGYSPHFLRALGLAAPLGVAVGLGAVEFAGQVRRRWGRGAMSLAIATVAVTLTAVAVWSGWAYLTRPTADLYTTYSYQVAAAGQYAADHPGSVVIIDYYSGTDIQFVYWDDPPAMVGPGTRIENPRAYSTIIALRPQDLADALGPEVGGHAVAVAWDPSGAPTVWAVAP
jgi:hypothetical protein